MSEKHQVKTLDKVVVRFSGDSGDGMQLAGNIFTNVSAALGCTVSTFPDYPAEIRAPQGSLSGVSGFQVSVGVGALTAVKSLVSTKETSTPKRLMPWLDRKSVV